MKRTKREIFQYDRYALDLEKLVAVMKTEELPIGVWVLTLFFEGNRLQTNWNTELERDAFYEAILTELKR